MQEPEPAEDWPERPLSEAEATDLLDDVTGAVAVWVMDHNETARSVAVGTDAPDEAVVDIVVETDDAFEMYSYTRGQWMDYGRQRRDDAAAPSMAGTLEHYHVLAGDSPSF